MEKIIRIGIADDHVLVREGIVGIISSFEGVEVVLQADDGRHFVDAIRAGTQVDLAILDLSMKELDGYQTARILRTEFPEIKMLALTQHDSDRYIIHFLECGGVGYLLKNTGKHELEFAIRQAHSKGYYVNELVSQRMLEGYRNSYRMIRGESPGPLSEMEQEVLELVALGFNSSQIGERLGRSNRTIDNHKASIMDKLNAQNSVHMVVQALRKGHLNLEQIVDLKL